MRQARKDAPSGRVEHAHASRDEHEADRGALGNVVDGDCERRHQSERLTTRERDPDAGALGEGVHGHQTNEKQGFAGIRGGQGFKANFRLHREEVRRRGHEQGAGDRPANHERRVSADAFVDSRPLAATMKPAASALATPSHERASRATNANGAAPSPVASAVASAAAKTAAPVASAAI